MASEVNEIAVQASENITENNEAITGRISSTSEGMVLAYGSLIIMAILPIFFGSYRAVRHHKEQQVSHAFDICFIRVCRTNSSNFLIINCLIFINSQYSNDNLILYRISFLLSLDDI